MKSISNVESYNSSYNGIIHNDFDLLLKVNDCVKITYTGLGRGKDSV